MNHARIVVIVLACTAVGCKQSSNAAERSQATAQTPEPKQNPGADAEHGKLQAAIECLNGYTGRVFEFRDVYLEQVDSKTGKPHRDKPALIGITVIDSCVRDAKQAAELKPAIAELDSATAAYVSALQGVDKARGDVVAYYDKGEHLDDKGKRGMELHPGLMTALETFGAAHAKLSSTVKTLNRARRVREVAAREKAEGRNLEVILDALMLEAETLVVMATAAKADAGALDAQLAAYGKLVDELPAYADTHADEAKQRGSLANIKNYSRTFLGASKVVAKKLEGKAVPSDAEREEVSKQYNLLVDNYNR